MSENIVSRKGHHIELCLDPESQVLLIKPEHGLDYCALPEINMANIDITTSILGKNLKAPIVIASMTGGSEHGRNINTNLALAAEKCGVALGVGSQRIGLEVKDAKDTFQLVRKNAPSAFLFANMGAVQLNYGHTVDSYRRVVDMIQADAIYLHLNPLQEALQPEGDTDFGGLLRKIEILVSDIGVPVFIKEVGHGISGEVAKRLFEIGVAGVDVAGVGGTSYAWIEAKRAGNENFQRWFKDFGIATPEAVRQCVAAKTNPDQIIIASGGVRSPVDGLKARLLGANLFSAAVPFLRPAIDSPEAVIKEIEDWKQGLRIAMFATGRSVW
jgi:isopentenyl-diphosphate Delta-isomerase